MVVNAGACAQIFVGYNHCGYHRYSTKLYVNSALMSAVYGQSTEIGLYLWGNCPLPTMQGLPPPVGSG